MELTGDCKKKFEKWINSYSIIDNNKVMFYIDFEQLNESCKYGVYIDFFESIGVFVTVINNIDSEPFYTISTIGNEITSGILNTRTEARKHSILKANELTNNR